MNDGFYQVIDVVTTPGQRPRSRAAGGDRRRRGRGRPAVRDRAPGIRHGPARAVGRGLEGHDAQHLVRWREPADRRVFRLLRDAGRRLRRPARARRHGRRPAARPEHRERADRGDRGELPGPLSCATRCSPDSEGPGDGAAGSGSGATTCSRATSRSRSWPSGSGSRRRGCSAAARRVRTTTSATPTGAATRYPSKFSVDLARRRDHEHPERRRRRLRRCRACAIRRSSARTSLAAGSPRARAVTSTALRSTPAGRSRRTDRDLSGFRVADRHRRHVHRRRARRRSVRQRAGPARSCPRRTTRREGFFRALDLAMAEAGVDDRRLPVGPPRDDGRDERGDHPDRRPGRAHRTEGFRDVLEIARQIRHELYDLRTTKPVPLVPRRWCARGPRAAPVRRLGHRAARRGVGPSRRPPGCASSEIRAVAVCLLHAYVNPVHEERVAEILRDEVPGLSVSLSSAIAPEISEYPRASTTVANAYVGPVLGRYIAAIERRAARTRRAHRTVADEVERRPRDRGDGARPTGRGHRIRSGGRPGRGATTTPASSEAATRSRSTWAARPRRSG